MRGTKIKIRIPAGNGEKGPAGAQVVETDTNIIPRADTIALRS
jgi:hypothetical protein